MADRSSLFASGNAAPASTAPRPGLCSPSGGLVWHARAARNRWHWRAFCASIEEWLQTWPHGCDKLLLLGPSAGWCLPTRFLCRFRVIRAVDLDPLAPYLFALMHGRHLRLNGTDISWCRANIMHDLEGILSECRGHAILFGNMLGQHRLHCTDIASAEADIGGIAQRLRGQSWASFHDRLSGAWDPWRELPAGFSHPVPLASGKLAKHFPRVQVWTDHLTEGLMPADSVCRYLPWPMERTRLHVVEAAWHPG